MDSLDSLENIGKRLVDFALEHKLALEDVKELQRIVWAAHKVGSKEQTKIINQALSKIPGAPYIPE